MQKSMPSLRSTRRWTSAHARALRSMRCARCGSTPSTSPIRSSAAARKATSTSCEARRRPTTACPNMLAVALIDGEVQPDQYAPERIAGEDVQMLLRRVTIRPVAALSARFPQRLPAELEVELTDGTILRAERDDYHGFHINPFDWTAARAKFDRVARAF